MNYTNSLSFPDKSDKVIQRTPGISGGQACIRNTRIPVWTLVSLLQQGATEQELLRNYPCDHGSKTPPFRA